MKDIDKIKDLVEEVLEEDTHARNSDLWLIIQIWQKKQKIKCFIPFEELPNLASPETITRCRRKLNEEGKYLPTNPQVLERRGIRQEEFREWAVSK